MKSSIVLFTFLFSSITLVGQNLTGAWENISTDSTGTEIRNVVILTEKFQVSTWYEKAGGKFVATNGGSWSQEGIMISELVEFDTQNPDRVGTTVTFEIEVEGDELSIKDSNKVWKRIDSGNPGALNGAWLITGRMRNGAIQARDPNRPRKTMKILSGTRFQWIAYNTETRQFSGTGGGTYTTVDGKYTENIEFFSRNNDRVGASLEFDYEIKEGDWHHSGNNSRGEPMYEVWSTRNN